MRFITIGYGAEADYDATDPALRDRAHRHDAALAAAGAIIGVAGVPTQVRNLDSTGVRTDDGPFLHAALPVAGFALIEAESLAAAIDLVAGTPCAIAGGVVEIWPLTTEITAESATG